jgi:hypothetical protein
MYSITYRNLCMNAVRTADRWIIFCMGTQGTPAMTGAQTADDTAIDTSTFAPNCCVGTLKIYVCHYCFVVRARVIVRIPTQIIAITKGKRKLCAFSSATEHGLHSTTESSSFEGSTTTFSLMLLSTLRRRTGFGKKRPSFTHRPHIFLAICIPPIRMKSTLRALRFYSIVRGAT